MRKNIYITAFLALSFAVGLLLTNTLKSEPLKEALTFFPLDPNASFDVAFSLIELQSMEDDDEYILRWGTESKLNQKAYLRQDVSLLFEDGNLKDTLSFWKEDTDTIKQKKLVEGEDSGHYKVVTFHHAELHYPNDIIKSAQTLSFDELYVIDSPLSPLRAFRTPETDEDKESKRILDHILEQQQKHDWDDLFAYYNIPEDKYLRVPLTQLDRFKDKPIPGLNQEETAKFLGGLWEGIYKNYVLSIQKKDGSIVSPIGTTTPLILIPENPDHFIIIFRTADGEPIQLLQTISY
ncbi:hypothetical protein [Halalkalibacter urbisdiaboli]|uniref:hypothetical protein n=1 Tax=Halalkalibacter urbisdiaboli TaxID=1960589 RepID=UPI001A98D324|nr:hypothetical protein [Halalkalibacter urbisdiaboli]